MVEDLYKKDCIRTFTGLYMNVFEPTFDMICIQDIAHSLSQQPRFGGHLPSFYSVAQHSLNCSYIVENPKLKLAALMHDAAEAYLMDIPKPIKQRLTNYNEIESSLMDVISKKFGFEYRKPPEVHVADETMLQNEWHHLMLKNDSWKLETYTMLETENKFIQMQKLYTTLK